MRRDPDAVLADRLLRLGRLTPEQLEACRCAQRARGVGLAALLLERRLVSPEEVRDALHETERVSQEPTRGATLPSPGPPAPPRRDASEDQAVRLHRRARPRGHGDRLPRVRHQPEARRGAQADPRPRARGGPRGHPVRARGDRCGAARPPGDREGLRGGRGRRRYERRYAEAIIDCDSALDQDPWWAPAIFERALNRFELNGPASGSVHAALQDLDRYLELAPDDVDAWLTKAAIGKISRDPAMTGAACDVVLRLQPGHPRALCLRAVARLDQGELAGALADVDDAIAAGVPRDNIATLRADVLERLDRLSEAVLELDTALVRLPHEAGILLRLVRLARLQRDTAREKALVAQGLRDHDTHPSFWIPATHLAVEAGDLIGALAYLDRAEAVVPAGPAESATRCSIEIWRARVLSARGDVVAARALLRERLGDRGGALTDLESAMLASSDVREKEWLRGLVARLR